MTPDEHDRQALFGVSGRTLDDRHRAGHRDGRPAFPTPTDDVVSIAELNHVDRQGYQRKMSLPVVENMARNWDVVLADYILVSRRKDGTLWVIDGQHRVAAATLAGETELLARVFSGLSEQQEADLFYVHSTQRRNITSLDKFHAGLSAAYPNLVEIASIVAAAGGKINRTMNSRSGINSVDTLGQILHFGGPDLLRDALDTLKEAFGTLDGPAAQGPNVAAMAFVLGLHGEALDRALLVRRLRRLGPEGLVDEAKAYEARRTRNHARYTALLDVYNRRTPEEKKLDEQRPGMRKLAPRRCSRCDRKHYSRGLCRPHYEAWFDQARRRIVDTAEAA